MKLTDVPESKGTFTQFGLNKFKFESFTIGDGQYGRQVTLIFTRPGKEEDKPFTQMTWYPLVNDVKDYWKLGQLSQFKDVLAVVDENYEETFEELRASIDFDENDLDSILKAQEGVITTILEKVVGQEVNVVLHYKGEYLNIPSFKDNKYQLTFGKNPIVYGGLNQTKAVPVQASAEEPASSGSGW